MRSIVKIWAWMGSIAFVILAAWKGSTVPFHEQWPLYEALRNTAAIIFAVVGAWLAIVYPERLKIALGEGNSTSGSVASGGKVQALMVPVVHSTGILAAVLAIGIIAPLIRQTLFVRFHLEFSRGLSYGMLSALTLWQLWTVILTLIPASDLSTKVDTQQRKHRTASSVTSRSRGE